MTANPEDMAASAPGVPEWVFRLMLNTLPDIVIILNRDRELIYTNTDGVYAPMKRFVGRDFLDVVPGPLREKARTHFERVIETREPVIVHRELVSTVGAPDRYFESKWLPIEVEGDVGYIALFSTNISERVHNEMELARSQERYRQLVDNSLDLIAIFSRRLEIRFVTPNVFEFMGYTDDELMGMSVFELVREEDVEMVRSKVEAVFSIDEPETLEIALRHKDGHFVTIEARGRSVGTKEKTLIVNARDVSQRKQTEALRQKLIRADKLAAVGQLAAGVAHEINNPAAFISTNLYVLRELITELAEVHDQLSTLLEDTDSRARQAYRGLLEERGIDGLFEDAQAMVDTNLAGMNRISRIVRDLRTYARDEPERIEKVDVNEAVMTSVNMIRSQIEYVAQLEIDLAPALPRAWAEHGRVSQVVINLLANAAHAVTEKEADEDLFVSISTRHENEEVVIRVEDNGIGMTPETERRLFEPFYSTKEPAFGTGLGLWLCSEIVESFKGSLEHQTAPDQGSTFEVRLPCKRLVTGEFRKVELPTPVGIRPRVLLIDDDEVVLESYRRVLESQFEVIGARGGKEAMNTLAEDANFDALLCDMDMPDVDGRAVHGHLGRIAPDLLERCVFTTSGAFTAEHRSFMLRVSNPVIHKPISTERLRELLLIASGPGKKS